MKLSTPRYTFCLFFQVIFMLCDLLFNCVSLFPRSRDGLLVLFIFQDLFLVLSITTMLMTFFSTYLFQAGLVEVLVRKFRAAGSVCVAYMVASVALHAAWLLEKWAEPESVSTPLLICLFTLQRCHQIISQSFYEDPLSQDFAPAEPKNEDMEPDILKKEVEAAIKHLKNDKAIGKDTIPIETIKAAVSPWYYFFYKRAALRVSDPRFYEDIDWINQQLQAH